MRLLHLLLAAFFAPGLASAAVTFNVGTNSCGSTGPLSIQAFPETNGVIGFKAYTAVGSPCSIFDTQLTASLSGGSGGTDTFAVSTLSFSFDFTILTDFITGDSEDDLDWSISMTINGGVPQILGSGTIVDPNSTGDTITGAATVNVPLGSTLTGWTLTLDFGQFNASGSPTLTLTIPQNSLDMNDPADTPEPAGFWLMAGGLLTLLGLWKRRQAA